MSFSAGGGEAETKKEQDSVGFGTDSGGGSSSSSDEDGGSRKRKAEPPTAAEAAATATLMSLPHQKLSKVKKDASLNGDASSKAESDHDLSTIEGQQALHPSMSIEEARSQVSGSIGFLYISFYCFYLSFLFYHFLTSPLLNYCFY